MNHRDETITGIFVLVGIAIIVVGGIWLSGEGWRGDFTTLQARFGNVGQLQTGNAVRIRGVVVGRVDAVEFAEQGVDVTLRIEADTPLPERPVVVLRPLSLFGEWGASIVPGGEVAGLPADTLSRPDGVLPGRTASDFAELSDYTADIASNLSDLTDRLELAFNEQTAENLAAAVQNFEDASSDLVVLLGRQRESFGGFADDMASAGQTLRGTAADLDSTVSRLEAATAEGELEAIFDNARRSTRSLSTVAGRLEGTTEAMNRTLARTDSAVTLGRDVLARLDRGEGSLGQLATDPALYENLAATLTELRALLDDLKQNPGKYFNFSIF